MWHDTYQGRTGGGKAILTADGKKDISVWSRAFGKWSENDSTIQFKNDTHAIQLGADIELSENVVAGIMGGYGRNKGKGYRLAELRTEADGKMLGAYVTYADPNTPLNVDATLSHTWLDMGSKLRDHVGYIDDDFDGDVWAFSVEAGYELKTASSWKIEPQVQFTYSKASMDKFLDSAGADISLDDGDELSLRAGVLFENNIAPGLAGYIRPNLIGTSGGEYDIKADDVKVSTDNDSFKYGIDAGFNWNLNKVTGKSSGGNKLRDASTYFNVGYEAGSDTDELKATLGANFKF